MKPCRRQNAASERRPAVPETPVHRYTHPIYTMRPNRRSTAEELLGEILEALSRQSELLEELLRRMGEGSREGK